MIVIVDYGMGNLGSVQNMLKRVGAASLVSADVDVIKRAEKLILPGVGAFDAAMESLEQRGFREVLDYKALEERVPILGICLGMQLLTHSSEEGSRLGLGWIPARTLAFRGRVDNELKVPHMGWNLAEPGEVPNPLTESFPDESRFYFVHSYFVAVDKEEHSVSKTEYGISFDSIICRDNVYGAQFHPEKSHKFGMQLFANFVGL